MKTEIKSNKTEAIDRVVQHIKGVTKDIIDSHLHDLKASADSGDWDEVAATAQEIKNFTAIQDACIKKVSNVLWIGDLIPTIINDEDLYCLYFTEDSLHVASVVFDVSFTLTGDK